MKYTHAKEGVWDLLLDAYNVYVIQVEKFWKKLETPSKSNAIDLKYCLSG